ncbi:hypothetical protein Unana1_06569 [Umbelopsis nana]
MPRTVDAIDRTPNYRQFIQELEAFHKEHGTALQAEPILGGQKLDLLKPFTAVMDIGGYTQVTKARLWKVLGDDFNFKATCTNSAYVLKAVYKKNLLGWELTTVWKQPWDPSIIMDPAEKPKANKKSKDKKDSREGNKRKKSPKTNEPRKVSKGDARLPHLTDNADQLDAFLRQLPDVLERAGQEPSPQRPFSRMQFLPHKGLDPKQQLSIICKKLVSKRPSDVQSATKIAQEYLEIIVEALIPYAQSVLLDPSVRHMHKDHTRDADSEASEQSSESDAVTHSVDSSLTFDAFRILRNLSLVEQDAEWMAEKPILRRLVLRGLTLPTSSRLVEIIDHSLDILDNISNYVKVSEPDEYVNILLHLLHCNDRDIILGVLKALPRLIIQQGDNYPFLANKNESVKWLIQFLLADDEELVTRTLEFLYIYTSAWPDFATQLLYLYSGNGISLLTSFLTYESEQRSQKNTPSPHCAHTKDLSGVCHDPKCNIPNLTHYQSIDEPYRCLGWLKQKFEIADTQSTLTLGDLSLLYESRFGMERPLDLEIFAVIFKIAYPDIQMTGGDLTTTSADQIIAHGIQIRISILDDGKEARDSFLSLIDIY